jgi:hypothetical protein
MTKYAPVAVYTYSRLHHLQATIAGLQANHLARETDLFVVSDGPRDERAKKDIDALRAYVDSIDGFKSVNRVYRNENFGAFKSMADAEHAILSDYGRIISLEDDIVTSANFLDFINAGLDFYEDCDSILTIAGYCHPIAVDAGLDAWISPWHCPWGYGTWEKKYRKMDLNANPLAQIGAIESKRLFLRKYGDFIIDILEADALGGTKATDARICGQMLLQGAFTVMPSVSKVQNIGCDGSGVNSPQTDRYETVLDMGQQRRFNFGAGVMDCDSQAVQNYSRFMNGNSVVRLKRGALRNLRKVEMLRRIKNNVSKLLA